MRVAQLVFAPIARAAFAPADELSATARGAGGFGHTGTGTGGGMSRAVGIAAPTMTPEKVWRLLVCWTIIVVAIYLAVSFVSYVPADAAEPGGTLREPRRQRSDACSRSVFIEPFGIGAFGLPFFMVFAAWRLRTRSKLSGPLLKLLGLVMVMLTLGVVFEVILPNRSLPRADIPVGGILGSLDRAPARPRTSDRWWSLVFSALGLGAALLVATDTFLLEGVASWIGQVAPPKTEAARLRERKRKAKALEEETTAARRAGGP